MNEKFYVITRLHKDDLRSLFRKDKHALEIIDNLSDTDMEYLAQKMANDYVEQLFWDSLDTIFRELYLKK